MVLPTTTPSLYGTALVLDKAAVRIFHQYSTVEGSPHDTRHAGEYPSEIRYMLRKGRGNTIGREALAERHYWPAA